MGLLHEPLLLLQISLQNFGTLSVGQSFILSPINILFVLSNFLRTHCQYIQVVQKKKLRIYDLEKSDAEPQVCSGHTGTISHIALSKDPNLILSGAAEEKFIAVWDRRTSAIENKLETPAQLSSFQVSIDGSIITAASGQFVSFWDSKKLSLIKTHKLSTKIDCASYHPNAKFFVTGTSLELWARAHDFNTAEEIAVNKGHHGPVRCLAFNPSGDAYASGSEDGTIRIWEWGKDKAKEKRKENGSGESEESSVSKESGEGTAET